MSAEKTGSNIHLLLKYPSFSGAPEPESQATPMNVGSTPLPTVDNSVHLQLARQWEPLYLVCQARSYYQSSTSSADKVASALGRGETTLFHVYAQTGNLSLLIDRLNQLQQTQDVLVQTINAIDAANWYTPIQVAAMEGHADLIQVLISNGADPTAKTPQGYNTYDLANLFHADKTSLIKYLADATGVIHNPQTIANTAISNFMLFNWAKTKSLPSLERLLTPENVNTQDFAGFTVLHYAAMTGDYDTACRVLSYNPNLNIRTFETQLTARDIAVVYHPETVGLHQLLQPQAAVVYVPVAVQAQPAQPTFSNHFAQLP